MNFESVPAAADTLLALAQRAHAGAGAGALLLLWAPPSAAEAAGRLQCLRLSGAQAPAALSTLAPGEASSLAEALVSLAQQLLQPGSAAAPHGAAVAEASTVRPLRSGPFQIEGAHGLVRWRSPQGWLALDLTEVERRLLRRLLQAAGKVCSREDIALSLWRGALHHPRTVDQCVRRLRASLLQAGVPDCVQTVRGLGYRLVPEAAQTR